MSDYELRHEAAEQFVDMLALEMLASRDFLSTPEYAGWYIFALYFFGDPGVKETFAENFKRTWKFDDESVNVVRGICEQYMNIFWAGDHGKAEPGMTRLVTWITKRTSEERMVRVYEHIVSSKGGHKTTGLSNLSVTEWGVWEQEIERPSRAVAGAFKHVPSVLY